MSFLARQSVIEEIVAQVSEYTGVPLAMFFGSDRTQDVARARMFVAWLVRRLVGASYAAIGRRLNRDHRTIMHGVRTIETAIAVDAELRALAVRIALVVGRRPVYRDMARALLSEIK